MQRQAAEMFGGDMPSMGDVEAMRGLEEGAVMGLVERRAMGEPLQYIIGESTEMLSHTLPCDSCFRLPPLLFTILKD